MLHLLFQSLSFYILILSKEQLFFNKRIKNGIVHSFILLALFLHRNENARMFDKREKLYLI
jgi:hypothetical protein